MLQDLPENISRHEVLEVLHLPAPAGYTGYLKPLTDPPYYPLAGQIIAETFIRRCPNIRKYVMDYNAITPRRTFDPCEYIVERDNDGCVVSRRWTKLEDEWQTDPDVTFVDNRVDDESILRWLNTSTGSKFASRVAAYSSWWSLDSQSNGSKFDVEGH